MEVQFPKQFSFIEAPVETISSLNRLVQYSLDNRVQLIKIQHRKCEAIDHCAEVVATVLAQEAYQRHDKRFWGHLPEDPELQRMVRFVGLPSVFSDNHQSPQDYKVFKLRRGLRYGKRESSDSTTSAEDATKDLVEYIDECLRTLGFKLTGDARTRYANLVVETINNAEVHSTRPDWWVAAYYKTEESQVWGTCHITIFCLGDSLAESLQRLPRNAMLRQDIEQRVAHHKELGFSRHWTEDDLWTLFAIQRGVSRQNDEEHEVGHYGQGTADLVEGFHALASTSVPPKMCVISGNTHILFDGRYRIKQNAEGRSRIAFNRANSLAQRPDNRYVSRLGAGFPGTLVSLRFVLDKGYLNEIAR
jgi:hypothetical protein